MTSFYPNLGKKLFFSCHFFSFNFLDLLWVLVHQILKKDKAWCFLKMMYKKSPDNFHYQGLSTLKWLLFILI